MKNANPTALHFVLLSTCTIFATVKCVSSVHVEAVSLFHLKTSNHSFNPKTMKKYVLSVAMAALLGPAVPLQAGTPYRIYPVPQQMTELAARTEGDPERYEVELKKMFDQLVILRGKLDLAKSQASQSDTVNAEVARIMDILKQTDISFTEFDDVTVRRLVECTQVCGNKKIIVTLKGGYQAEEELRRIEAA